MFLKYWLKVNPNFSLNQCLKMSKHILKNDINNITDIKRLVNVNRVDSLSTFNLWVVSNTYIMFSHN